MRISTAALVIVASLGFACGGAPVKEAKAPEADMWSDFTGKYGSDEPAAVADSPTVEKTSKSGTKTKGEAAQRSVEGSSGSAAKRISNATIQGESVSSVGLDAIASATKMATKSKIVSTKYLVGPKYEQLQISLKGAAIQLIRPAAIPAPDGPPLTSPKARSGGVTKKESGFYDPAADVVVVVSAGKKAGADKLLSAILKQ